MRGAERVMLNRRDNCILCSITLNMLPTSQHRGKSSPCCRPPPTAEARPHWQERAGGGWKLIRIRILASAAHPQDGVYYRRGAVVRRTRDCGFSDCDRLWGSESRNPHGRMTFLQASRGQSNEFYPHTGLRMRGWQRGDW